jgi:hypothetical protein
MKNLLNILILFLAFPCMGQTRKSISGPDKFFEINYEDILKNKKVVPLSQVATNVEYIKLETNKDCLIRGINDNQVYRPLNIISLKKELEDKSEEFY